MGSLKPTSIPGVSHSSPPPSPAGHQPPWACSLPRHTPGVPPRGGSVFESDSVGWWVPPPAKLGPGSRPGLETIPRGFLQAGFGSSCVCEWTPGGGGVSISDSILPGLPGTFCPPLFRPDWPATRGRSSKLPISRGWRRRPARARLPRCPATGSGAGDAPPVLRWSRLLFSGLCLTPRGDCTGQFQFLVDLPGGGLASTWEILPVTGAMCQKKFRP